MIYNTIHIDAGGNNNRALIFIILANNFSRLIFDVGNIFNAIHFYFDRQSF